MKKSLKFFLSLIILSVIVVPVYKYNSSYANMIAPPERMIKYSGDFQDDNQEKAKQEASEKQKPQLKEIEQKKKEGKSESKKQKKETVTTE